MFHDPVVEEIHQIRAQLLAEIGDDWDALLAYFQNQPPSDRLVDPAEVRRQGREERSK